jgi:hypothetical protein
MPCCPPSLWIDSRQPASGVERMTTMVAITAMADETFPVDLYVSQS